MFRAIGDYTRAELDAADRRYRRWVRRMSRAKRFLAWIAEDDRGRPIGSGALWLTEAQPRPRDPGPYRPYVLSMYTDPRHRGAGVASAIVRHAVQYAKDRRYSRITLHASEMGRPVYARLGFEPGSEMRRRVDVPVRRPRTPARRRRPR